MTRFRNLVAAVALFATAGCGLTEATDVPYQDSPNLNALEDNPTPAIITATAQGLLDAMRDGVTSVLSELSHYGREGYYLSAARTILPTFDNALTPASGGIGWNAAYNRIRTTNALRTALGKITTGMTEAQKEGVRGWAKTVEAFLLHGQIRIHDTFGIVVDTDRPRSELGPMASKADVYTFIIRRLDEAYVHLGAGGTAFSFALSPGFAGFNTPANFARVNRALKARVQNDLRDYAGVLATLPQTFINPTGDLATGAYNSFGTGSGDSQNPYFDPVGLNYLADTMFVVQAQRKADGAIDDRVTRKVAVAPQRTHTGVSSHLRWAMFTSNSSPIPIIKNEELILIRAEARWFTGDKAGALEDINTIRTRSGGLAPTTLTTASSDDAFISELLYNRRYSLVFEYGHRWNDLRKFGRLVTDLVGPRGAGDRIFERVPFPTAECDQRADALPAGCSQVDGTRTTR